MRKYFQRLYFCELCLKNCKFHRRYFVNTNQKLNFTEDIFAIYDQKVNLAIVLTSIKRYLTLFWQCSYLDLIFRKRHFRELVTKLQKYVLVKISSMINTKAIKKKCDFLFVLFDSLITLINRIPLYC